MKNVRFKAGLSLLGVMAGMTILAGFLGTYFFLQKRVERIIDEDDKAVVGQLLASELLEIVQGIKTANYLQCRQAFDEALDASRSGSTLAGASSPSDVASSSVCQDWDKGFDLPSDDGSGNSRSWVYDHNTSLQDPSSSNAFKTSCDQGSASTDCQVYRANSPDRYVSDNTGRSAPYRRFVTITDTATDEITATAYVFVQDRYNDTYGTQDGNANFTSSMKLYNTDL